MRTLEGARLGAASGKQGACAGFGLEQSALAGTGAGFGGSGGGASGGGAAGVGECQPRRQGGGRCGDPRNFSPGALVSVGMWSASWAFLSSSSSPRG